MTKNFLLPVILISDQQEEVSFALHIILFIKFFPLLSIRRSTLNFRTSSIQDQTIDQNTKTRFALKLSNDFPLASPRASPIDSPRTFPSARNLSDSNSNTFPPIVSPNLSRTTSSSRQM